LQTVFCRSISRNTRTTGCNMYPGGKQHQNTSLNQMAAKMLLSFQR